MTPLCPPPDASLGVALRLSSYVSCQARALGENGFQALAGGPLGTSVLSGLVTIFVALIGYRLILGQLPDLRDGIGWTTRLGIVLALVTSWPAFQTLVYRVAVDGPGELASVLLPASGLPSSELSGRVQSAYDTIRLGTAEITSAATAQPGAAQQLKFQSPLPNTASLLIISTVGVIAAFEIVVGFLLAVAPLAFMSLLFDGTSSLFNGWLRALAGAALTITGATIVTAIDLVLVESELGRIEVLQMQGASAVVDPQAVTTIVSLFAVAMIVMLIAATRMASALKLVSNWRVLPAQAATHFAPAYRGWAKPVPDVRVADRESPAQSRVAAVVQVLAHSAHRDTSATLLRTIAEGPVAVGRHSVTAEAVERSVDARVGTHGPLGRRHRIERGTGMAARRDRRT